MCGFDGIQRDNYFRGEPIGRAEVEVRMGKPKNGKAVGKDEITGEMVKGRVDRVMDWIWRLCNIAFESRVVLFHCLRERGLNCRGISLLSLVVKIYMGILVYRVYRVTKGLIRKGALKWGGVVKIRSSHLSR